MWEQITSIDQRKAAQWLARLLCLLLAALVIWQLARIVWLLVPGQPPPTHLPSHSLGTVPLRDSQGIARWHLFGSSLAQRRAAGPNTPTTTLGFILRGTLADSDPRSGVAVIDDGQGQERAWRVGEDISTSVSLAEVHADHVVLLHDGQPEVLRMPRSAIAAPADAIPQAVGGGSPAATPAKMMEPVSLPAGAAGDWQKLGDAMRADPTAIARDVGLVPVFSGGRMTGVKAGEHADAALLAQLGLQANDVVTAVNGVALDSPARAPQLMQTLSQAHSAQLTLLRDGATIQITVTLK